MEFGRGAEVGSVEGGVVVGIGGGLGAGREGGGTGRERVCIGWILGGGGSLKSLFFSFFFFFDFGSEGFSGPRVGSRGFSGSRVGRHLPSPDFPCSRRVITRYLRKTSSFDAFSSHIL